MRRILAASVAVLALCGTASAREIPRPSPLDRAIKTAVVNSRNVIWIYGVPGYATDIVLHKGEYVEYHSLAEPKAWSYGYAKGSRDVFIKPIKGVCIQPNATATACGAVVNSSLTIVTNKHHYQFELHFIPNPNSPLATVELRLRYPKTEKEAEKREIAQAITNPQPCGECNLWYEVPKGWARLGLVNAWDNGQFTYFKFAPNAPLPAIFFWGPGKQEATAPSSTEGAANNILVVPSISHRWLLRLGKQYTGVWNEDYGNERFENTSGTASPSVKRVIRSGDDE